MTTITVEQAGFRPPPNGWDEHAACAGVDRDGRDRFHPATTLDPDKTGNATAARSYEIARIYCRACPVTVDCLTAALAAETPSTRAGIWGGLSPRQRTDLTPDSDLPAAITAALQPRHYSTRARHPRAVEASDRTDFTDAEQRAANAAVDRWRRGRGLEPTADQIAAYRAYQRNSRAARRQATG